MPARAPKPGTEEQASRRACRPEDCHQSEKTTFAAAATCPHTQQVLPLLQLTGARGDMAARNQPNASDSFVEQLLRSGPDVSGHDHTEAEAEEVDYGETDEDAQDAEGPHRVDRGRGARRSPAERGKHDPISWREWQPPEPHRHRSRSRSRGIDPRSFRERHPSQEHRDSARTHALAREQADAARWRAEQERLPWPKYEDSLSPRRMRLERSFYSPERAYYSMRDPRDGYPERGHSLWESAHHRHPSDPSSLPERLEPHDGRAGSLDGQLHPRSPSLLRERTHAHMSHPRARLLAPEPAGGLWQPQPGENAVDRRLPQRRILLQRAGPEEERLIVRRPLSPEGDSPSDAWYLRSMNGSLAASRRVEYDPRPSFDYPLVKEDGVWRHGPLSSSREGTSYRRLSPDAGHHSILHAARGASLPRETPESPSRMRRQLSHGQGYHREQEKASATARDSAKPSAPAPGGHSKQLPGPPVLPGPPPVSDDHSRRSQRRRNTLFSDAPSAREAQQAPSAALEDGEQAQPQAQPNRPAGRAASEEDLSKDAPQETRPHGADGMDNFGESQAGKEKAASITAASGGAGSLAVAELAGRAAETALSKRPAESGLADRRDSHSHSKRPRSEADPQRRTSTALEVDTRQANASLQGMESVDCQKARSRDSKRSQSTEARSNVLPQQLRAEEPQGHGAAESKEPKDGTEGFPDITAVTTRRADKEKPEGGSTFVRDFYARSERSASEKAADPKTRPREAKRASRDTKKPAKGRSHETNGAASSKAMREAPRTAVGRRDALKELRDRGGVRALRSVGELDGQRSSRRRLRGSSRDGKSGKPARLPSWLGDKPEDCNEWYYMDPKGKLQGPCSISSFRLWLMRMKENSELDSERKEFLKCMVWRKGMNRREPLERLLALADAEASKQKSTLS